MLSEQWNVSQLKSKLEPWFEARKKFKLSHAHIQMARELGMNPRGLGSLANHRQEMWKAPLPVFIESCYEKRFKRTQPESVRSLEEMIEADEKRRAEKRERKAGARPGTPTDILAAASRRQGSD